MKIYTIKGMIEICKYCDSVTTENGLCFECLIMEGLI
jgi:hypothetical protein